MKAVNIQWGVNNKRELKYLPREIVIPTYMENDEDKDRISDYIANVTGHCHFGYDIVDDDYEVSEYVDREFYIDTPVGRLHVYAKHDSDNAENFPGVYIDLVKDNDDYGDMLACVEYDSAENNLQTCVYQPGQDEPTQIVIHDVE